MNASYGIARDLTVSFGELAIARGRSYVVAMRLVALVLFVLSSPAMLAATDPLRTSRQCLVVVAENWNAKTGVLRAFERTSARNSWQPHGRAVPVVLGKRGMAWGRGLIDFKAAARKVEGDNKAPAGVFRLGPAFGYAPKASARWIRPPYVQLTKNTEGVDDPRARHFKKAVYRFRVPQVH